MPKVQDDKERKVLRRRNHIARDLATPKYKQRIKDPRRLEDETERRFRRYRELDDGES